MNVQDQELIREPSDLLLIHHMANRDHEHPPGTLPALRACFEAGARVIEIDISLLADNQFALLHGPLLEHETTGSGPIRDHTTEQVRELRHLHQGKVTGVAISFLSEAIELLRQYPGSVELQLDLGKNREPGIPPFRQGAYGYWDDHPLASRRWGSAADYLAARAEALCAQVPTGMIWYIHAWLLGKGLDDGFDWIAYLHSYNAQVDAWTLDAHRPEHVALAQRLIAQGVDRITTNDAPALVQVLGVGVRY